LQCTTHPGEDEKKRTPAVVLGSRGKAYVKERLRCTSNDTHEKHKEVCPAYSVAWISDIKHYPALKM
jgi:hypothetical protein